MTQSVQVELPSQGTIRPRRLHLEPFTSDRKGGSVLAYHGIPFAQPPTGTRRWRVPQGPLPRWSGVRKSRFTPDPEQEFLHMEGMMHGRRGARDKIKRSEDCLYLNLWVPEGARTDRSTPVMVWIYGGSFVVGNTSRPMYDAARLAFESGCIIVSLPYRVGPLGFLGSKSMAEQGLGEHPLISASALTSSDPWTATPSHERAAIERTAGNWGLWDLVAGLLWVQHSIRHFDGDTNNVTIFGESAGSIAIHYLLISPVVPRQLFNKAILQSGVAFTVLPATTEAAQAAYDHVVAKLVPPSIKGEREQLEYLRTQVSADAVSAVLRNQPARRPRSEYHPSPGSDSLVPDKREDFDPTVHRLPTADTWGPAWDASMVSVDLYTLADSALPPRSQLRNGQDGIVIGYTADEGSMFSMLIGTPEAVANHVAEFPPAIREGISALYSIPAITDSHAPLSKTNRQRQRRQAALVAAMYIGDALFHAPILSYIEHQARRSPDRDATPVYAYALTHQASTQWLETVCSIPEMAEEMGSFHTLDVAFVFGFTGLEAHTYVASADEYGVDPDDVAPPPSPALREAMNKGKGMTPAERQLSIDVMQSWSDFARSNAGAPLKGWTPVQAAAASGELADVTIRHFADRPQLSVFDQLPAPSATERIEVGERRLSDLRHFGPTRLSDHANAGKGASLAERTAYWMKTADGLGTTPYLVNFYGWQDGLPVWRDWKSTSRGKQIQDGTLTSRV